MNWQETLRARNKLGILSVLEDLMAQVPAGLARNVVDGALNVLAQGPYEYLITQDGEPLGHTNDSSLSAAAEEADYTVYQLTEFAHELTAKELDIPDDDEEDDDSEEDDE